jgi:hypothetical protein
MSKVPYAVAGGTGDDSYLADFHRLQQKSTLLTPPQHLLCQTDALFTCTYLMLKSIANQI